MADEQTSSGVQELIDRLSEEGVAAGRREADEILSEVRQKAEEILTSARAEAEQIEAKARTAAEQFRVAGEDAVRLACRDAIRDLSSQIHENFRQRLQRLISQTLENEEFLKSLILEVAGQVRPEHDQEARLLLPAEAISDDAVREQIESGDEDALTNFVRSLTGDSIREGISFSPRQDGRPGMKIQVVNDQVEIDLTDESLAEVIAEHVLPRFRAIIRQA